MPASSPPLPSPESARELSLSASIRGAEACRRGAGGAGCVRLALLWLIYAIELLCPGTENGSNCRSRDRGVGVAGARGGSRFIVVHLRISVALKFSTKHTHTHRENRWQIFRCIYTLLSSRYIYSCIYEILCCTYL